MLSERFEALVSDVLIPRTSFHPYPTVDDRASWESLPEDVRRAQVEVGEQYLGFAWPPLPATLFMEYERTGNRSNYERVSFARRNALASLAIAECVENKGRFLDDIINGIWAICEESFWGVPAHNSPPSGKREPLPDTAEPIIDLFAGETVGLLALVHYLLKPRLDAVSGLIARRIVREAKARIIDPFLNRSDFWWMGLEAGRRVNNWNPWCTSNCLTALLLLEEDEERRRQGVAKSLRILDAFLASYPPDGGCDEGASYWGRAGGSLFDCLDLLALATGGAIDVFSEPLIAEIGRYMVRVYIDGDYFVNFADGSAKLGAGDQAPLLFRYGRRVGDPQLESLGAARYRMHKDEVVRAQSSLLRKLPALFALQDLERTQGDAPFLRDSWLPDTQVMIAREREGSALGLFLAAKGGHNQESHNHNDVGSFIVYVNGEPALIDAGVGTYTKQTFSKDRYSIWTMRSSYHNLPTIGGVEQRAGGAYRATGVSYSADGEVSALSLDIASAYPKEAGVLTWRRTIELRRGGKPCVVVTDDFELAAAQEIVWTLMTPKKAEIDPDGSMRLSGGALVAYEARFGDGSTEHDAARRETSEEPGAGAQEASTERGNDSGDRVAACDAGAECNAGFVEASQERIAVDDGRLGAVWGDSVYRVLLRTRRPVKSGRLSITVCEESRRL